MRRQYPQLIWGNEVSVERRNDQLIVSAREVLSDEDAERSPDVLRDYRSALKGFGEKRFGKASPHIVFANADTDEKLTAFVQHFGPVVVASWKREQRPFHSRDPFDLRESLSFLVATQDLAELRNERQIYYTVLILMSELKRSERLDIETVQRCIREIEAGAFDWPKQWQREKVLREDGMEYGGPGWFFDHENLRHLGVWLDSATRKSSGPLDFFPADPVHAGHRVICELINAFPPVVYPWGATVVEAPQSDLAGGIRPVLYYILRREYLCAGAVGICRNTDCRELFEIERASQDFCSDVCSRHQRQREYWADRGKKLRERRHKANSAKTTVRKGR